MKIGERLNRLAEIQERIDLRLGHDETLCVDRKIVHALARRGFLVDDVPGMSDREVLCIPDIGPEALRKLRELEVARNA